MARPTTFVSFVVYDIRDMVGNPDFDQSLYYRPFFSIRQQRYIT
jgi:hypothetical protein